MASWVEFQQARPDLADAGKQLFYQFGVGLGFLARFDRMEGHGFIPFARS